MKLSKKQIDVIRKMRDDSPIHWVQGLNPHCFLSGDLSYPLSTSTFFALEDKKLIFSDVHREKFELTELSKTIELK